MDFAQGAEKSPPVRRPVVVGDGNHMTVIGAITKGIVKRRDYFRP
jgi:hypothetical protein